MMGRHDGARRERGRLLLRAIDRFLEAGEDAKRKRRQRQVERALEEEVADAFREEGKAFDEETAKGTGLTQATAKAVAAGRPALAGALAKGMQAALEIGAEGMAATLSLAFDLRDPRVARYLEEHGAELVKGIDEETRRQIKTLIQQGGGYDAIAKRISERFAEFAVGRPQDHIDSRAHLVAVTEVGNALEHGSWLAAQDAKQAGLPMEKAWLVTGGDICDECVANEAAGWIDIDEPFPSGDDAPLAHPACRCTALYRRRVEG
jgi:hypothetical protein